MKSILILLLAISATSLIGCYYNPHYGHHDNGRHERRGNEHDHRDSDRRGDGHQGNSDHHEH